MTHLLVIESRRKKARVWLAFSLLHFLVYYAHISFYMHFRFFFSLFQESFDSSKPITADDVHQVFDNLAKKRRRVE